MNCVASKELVAEQEFWQQVHGITMSVIWILVADGMLIVARYWKSWNKYILVHSLFGLFNLVGVTTVIIVIVYDSGHLFNECFWTMRTSAQAHFILGMCFIAMLVAVQSFGLVSKFGIESKTVDPVTLQRRKTIHMYLGYFLYLFSKVQVLLGWWVYNYAWGTMMTVCVVYYSLFFAFKYLLLERWYAKQDQILYRSIKMPLCGLSQYDGLLQMLGRGVNKFEIMKEYPDTKYVMYKYKVYDVTGLVHPGGAFIIQKVIGEEISRYIHGAYGLESTKMSVHSHSMFAQRLLQEYYVADIDTSNQGLIVPIKGDRHNVPTLWRLAQNTQLSSDIKLFYFTSDRYMLSNSPNIFYLGRHFLLSPVNIPLASRLYSLCLCMSPSIRQHVRDLVDKLGDPFKPNSILKQDRSEYLPFVIKLYQVGGFSEYLHNSSESDQIKIEGPFGRGLEIEEGILYAFCGGTGILPLLDLVYEILLRIYSEKVEKKHLNRLPDKFKLVLYWAISKAEVLDGLQVITDTYLMAKKHNMDIFELHLRTSSGESIKGIPQFSARLNFQTVKSVFSSPSQVSKAIICGSPAMNYEVYHAVKRILPQQKIHIM